MRQAVMLIGSFVALSLFAGCSTDPTDLVIEDAVKELGNARTHMNSISSKLETMIGKAEKGKKDKKDEKDWKITRKDLKPLEDTTKKLREVGQEFVDVEERAKRFGQKLDPAQREALKEKHQSRIRATLQDVEKSYRRLVTAKENAIACTGDPSLAANKEVADYLDEELRIALQEFESLTRQ